MRFRGHETVSIESRIRVNDALYSIVLTSVHSDDLALQIVQRTSPEYPWIDLSAQWTLEAYNIPVLLSWAFPRIAFLCNVL